MRLLLFSLSYLLATRGAGGSNEIPKVYIDRGSPSDSIPCMGLQPDEGISTLYWYKGPPIQEAIVENQIIRYDSNVDTNLTASDRYSLTEEYGLKIADVDSADSGSYWCRVIRQVTGRQSQDQVDLVVIVVPEEPKISPCESSKSNTCEVEASTSLVVQCTVSNAFPSPDLTWSFIGCEEGENVTEQWFVSNQRTSFDPESETYDVACAIYLGEFQPKGVGVCLFRCVATGSAISEEKSSSILSVSGNAKDGMKNINSSIVGLAAVVAILVILLLISSIFTVHLVRDRRKQRVKKSDDVETDADSEEMIAMMENWPGNDSLDINASRSKDIEEFKDIPGETNFLKYEKDVSLPDHRGSGVVKGVVDLSGGRLIIATKSNMHTVSYELKLQYIQDVSTVVDDFSGITSIAKCTKTDFAVVGCKRAVFCENTNTGVSVQKSMDFKAINPRLSVDASGMIFWGDAHGRSISRKPYGGGSTIEHRIEISLINVAAYGSNIIFVNDGKCDLHKYRTGGGLLDKIKRDKKFHITMPEGATLGQMTVSGGALYIVSCSTAIGSHNILQCDVNSGKLLQTYKTEMSDLNGLCFFGKTKVALYGGNWVKIYDIINQDQADNRV